MSTLSPKRRRGLPGSLNPNWKGGRTVDPRGYVLLKMPEHPRADCRGYVYEHIFVAEQTLGRPILPTEDVHHKDENKGNNHPSNLEVAPSRRHHQALHRKRADLRGPDEPNPTVLCACGCGATLLRYDSHGRPRCFVSGHNIRKAS